MERNVKYLRIIGEEILTILFRNSPSWSKNVVAGGGWGNKEP